MLQVHHQTGLAQLGCSYTGRDANFQENPSVALWMLNTIRCDTTQHDAIRRNTIQCIANGDLLHEYRITPYSGACSNSCAPICLLVKIIIRDVDVIKFPMLITDFPYMERVESMINTENSHLWWRSSKRLFVYCDNTFVVKTLLRLVGPQEQHSQNTKDNPWLIPDYTLHQ